MHTVEMLEHALTAARQLGYKVRQEWFGLSGGVCEIKGQKWIFLDLSMSPQDQLSLVLDALHGDPGLARLVVCPELSRVLRIRLTA